MSAARWSLDKVIVYGYELRWLAYYLWAVTGYWFCIILSCSGKALSSSSRGFAPVE
jgi:hypothetical protein